MLSIAREFSHLNFEKVTLARDGSIISILLKLIMHVRKFEFLLLLNQQFNAVSAHLKGQKTRGFFIISTLLWLLKAFPGSFAQNSKAKICINVTTKYCIVQHLASMPPAMTKLNRDMKMRKQFSLKYEFLGGFHWFVNQMA